MQFLSHGLLGVVSRENISYGLVRAREIILDIDMITDLEEDDGGSNNERDSEENPVADEFLLVRQLARIKVVDNSRAAGLNALVKADIVGRATTRVGESAHEPIHFINYQQ
jgi:hypothetical protein